MLLWFSSWSHMVTFNIVSKPYQRHRHSWWTPPTQMPLPSGLRATSDFQHWEQASSKASPFMMNSTHTDASGFWTKSNQWHNKSTLNVGCLGPPHSISAPLPMKTNEEQIEDKILPKWFLPASRLNATTFLPYLQFFTLCTFDPITITYFLCLYACTLASTLKYPLKVTMFELIEIHFCCCNLRKTFVLFHEFFLKFNYNITFFYVKTTSLSEYIIQFCYCKLHPNNRFLCGVNSKMSWISVYWSVCSSHSFMGNYWDSFQKLMQPINELIPFLQILGFIRSCLYNLQIICRCLSWNDILAGKI
jgi:hypothetical protein